MRRSNSELVQLVYDAADALVVRGSSAVSNSVSSSSAVASSAILMIAIADESRGRGGSLKVTVLPWLTWSAELFAAVDGWAAAARGDEPPLMSARTEDGYSALVRVVERAPNFGKALTTNPHNTSVAHSRCCKICKFTPFKP